MRMRLYSLLLFLVVVIVVDAVRDGKCPSYGLPCGRHGTCMYGSKDYQSAFAGVQLRPHEDFMEQATSKYGMYCDCNEQYEDKGYTGLYCNIQYDKCSSGNMCMNGATCVDDSLLLCNCATTGRNGNKFEGTHCQHEATEWCEGDSGYDVSESRKWYCTNGTCRSATSVDRKCDCNEGFYGLHCEFTEEKDCTRQCDNGGMCKHGIKDYSSLTDNTKIIEFLSKESSYETHCVCPVGFTGLNCEITVSNSLCGDGECFYGADCVQDTCDCKSISKNDALYAGDYCEIEIRPNTTTMKHKNHHEAEDTFIILFLAIFAIVALFFGLVFVHHRSSATRRNAPVEVAQDEVVSNTRSTFIGEIDERNNSNDSEDNDKDHEIFIGDVGDDDLSFEDDESVTQMEII